MTSNRSIRPLSILYRGPLSSCNYDCHYCPFAKRTETEDELARDQVSLARFVARCESLAAWNLQVFFTPWGEALVRPWYWEAFARLSRCHHVGKVAAQTNLSCRLDWLADCDVAKVALWCTYHPGETSRMRFLTKCRQLLDQGVAFSVGVVGLREHFSEISLLREELPSNVYVWVNAYKDVANYYAADEIQWLATIDPHFAINCQRYASLGQPCRTGDTVVSIDGEGVIRRCHFVADPLRVASGEVANFYRDDFAEGLRPRVCPRAQCSCHIGYVHLESLQLEEVYGERILERVPTSWGRQPAALEMITPSAHR
jgi:hypothetical protein